jgi:adenosine deaminase
MTHLAHSLKWPQYVTELHVHLGGSVPLYRLWEIAIDRGIRGMGDGYEEFLEILKIDHSQVKDLDSYLEVYDKVELIQSGPTAVRESIIIAVHGAYRTRGMLHLGPGGEGGAPYPLFTVANLELRFNPLKRTGAVFLKGKHAGLYDVDRVIKSACDAVEEVHLAFKGKMRIGLLFCFGRDMTYEANKILAEKTAVWAERSNCIVGTDLAGPESVNPLTDPQRLREMKEVFSIIPSHLGRTIHVGETPHVDLNTFVNTVIELEPQRVAHPIVAFRALQEQGDDSGVKLLADRGITCEFCVKSNLLTGAVKSLDEYRQILETCDRYNIPYTFSTDAPALQVTSLAEELMMLLDSQCASPDQVIRALNAADSASFLS